MDVVKRQRKWFGIKGGRLSNAENLHLSESVTTSGVDGTVVTIEEGLETGMYADCGCLITGPKEVGGRCQYPGCGALICRAHAGACEREGLLVCRSHLRQVAVSGGEKRSYCARCAWRYAFWEMLLGGAGD